MKQIVLALLLTLGVAGAAFATDGAPSSAGIVHRYFVTVNGNPFDAEQKAAEVARKYGATLLPSENRDDAFAMEMTEAMAEGARRDPAVVSIEEGAPETVTTIAAPHVVPSVPTAFRQEATAPEGSRSQSDGSITAESARAIKPTAGTDSWTIGPYAYDAAGNILSIGTDSFAYDSFSRLKSGTIYSSAGSAFTQTYTYDVFGNMLTKATTGGTTATMGVTPATNRMDNSAAGNLYGTYDAAGNMKSLGSWSSMAYDAAGMMTSLTGAAGRIEYVYDANDERIAIVNPNGTRTWTLRGLDNKVLREYSSNGSTFTWVRDTVYRNGGLLLAEITPSGAKHYHLDHLGTPRMVTDASGIKVDEYDYYPFGEIAYEQATTDSERMHFTGHERDFMSGSASSTNSDELDYMHHRYYVTASGRFGSVDPGHVVPNASQSWNRYSYVHNQAVGSVDPDGRDPLGAVVGGVVGATGGAILEAYHQGFGWNRPYDNRRVLNAAIGTGTTGALAGACDCPIWIEGGATSSIGGYITRGLNGEKQTLGAVFRDGLLGIAGAKTGKSIAGAVTRESISTSTMKAAAANADSLANHTGLGADKVLRQELKAAERIGQVGAQGTGDTATDFFQSLWTYFSSSGKSKETATSETPKK